MHKSVVITGSGSDVGRAIALEWPMFTAQMLTCLKLSGCKLGLIINFNVEHLRDGIVTLRSLRRPSRSLR
jgi:hypothetical protein